MENVEAPEAGEGGDLMENEDMHESSKCIDQLEVEAGNDRDH